MKIQFAVTLLVGLAAMIIVALAQSVEPSGEFIINTNQSTNLNASFIRVTGGKLAVDNALTNWVLEVRWEAWRTNGATARIADRGQLKLNMADLKALMNAQNPKNALKTAILTDAALTEKP